MESVPTEVGYGKRWMSRRTNDGFCETVADDVSADRKQKAGGVGGMVKTTPRERFHADRIRVGEIPLSRCNCPETEVREIRGPPGLTVRAIRAS